MPDSAEVAAVRKAVDRFLRQEYGSADTDTDRDFVVRNDGTVTWIRAQPIDEVHTAVIVFSPVALGMRVDDELTRFLATEGLNLAFAHFELHERATPMVVVSHTLLGEFLSREELTTAVEEVSSVARRYGPEISERYGGSMPAPRSIRSSSTSSRVLGDAVGRGERRRPPTASTSTTTSTTTSTMVRNWCGVAALVVGVAAAAVAYGLESSWWLAGFVFAMVSFSIGVVVPEVLTEPDKLRRAAYFGNVPLLSTLLVALSFRLWDRWWLAVAVGSTLGVLGAATIGGLLFSDIVDQEVEQAKATERQSYSTGGAA